jgi:hypothetical protein
MSIKTAARTRFAPWCVFCVGLFPTLAIAASDELSFSAFVAGADYVAREYRNGALFNRDAGTLDGSYLRGGYTSGSWRLGVEHRYVSGTIDYQGQNQLGLPIESQTELKYSQLGTSAIYQLRDMPFYAGITLRSRKIDRRIQATPITQALHETLQQTEWGPVAGAEWNLSEYVSFAVQMRELITERSTLDVDFLGTYDAGRLNLPRNANHDIQLELGYRINPSYALAMEICEQRLAPARSSSALLTKNGEPVGLYNYPGSTQNIWTLGIGAIMRW